MPDLPPVYQTQRSSFTRFLYSLITLFVMLGALPIGVYLVGQQTNFRPKAFDATATKEAEISFILENTLGSQKVDNGVIPVDLVVRSEKESTNLFVAKLSFSADLLEVQSIATSSAKLEEKQKTRYFTDRWIDSSFDNQKGQISLIAGVPNPGLKTDPNSKYVLATIFVKAKGRGLALLSLTNESAMYKNSDNSSIVPKRNELSLDLDNLFPNGVPTLACQIRPACLDEPSPCKIAEPANGWCPSPTKVKKNEPILELLSPKGGEVYSYTAAIPVIWNAVSLKEISLSLYMNGAKLGKITTVGASSEPFSFKASDFVSPSFITVSNTFGLEISSVTDTGQVLSAKTAGPFGITAKKDVDISASQSANLALRGGDANKDGKVDLTDLSILLSHYNTTNNLDAGVDLNGDWVVNDIDLYLMRGLLINSGVIRGD